MTNREGQQLGNYRLVRLLGQGGFAQVYLGEHIHLETQAAVKVLHTQVDSNKMELFRKEARTIARLEHPRIVRVLEFGIENDSPYLVMTYAPNGTLRQRHPKGEQLPLKVILPYVEQIAEALQYIYDQKLIHRDVKPENLLLDSSNNILLSDFGIASVAHTTVSLTTEGQAGTPHYMAPEQIMNRPSSASDQYALGVVVYEWLCGIRPFQGNKLNIFIQHLHTPPPALREWLSTIPPLVEVVVLKALAKDPKQRFTSVKAFANALKQASQAEQTTPFIVLGTSIAPSFTTPMVEEERVRKVREEEQARRAAEEQARKAQASATEQILNPTPVGGLMKKWAYHTGGYVSSPPAVANGVVYVGSTDGNLYALDATTGTKKWAYQIGDGIKTSPAVAGGVVYVSSRDRNLYALDAATGTKKWAYQIGRYIASTPSVVGGVVYVGSTDGNLYALDAATGTKKWAYQTRGVVFSTPSVVGGVIYVGSRDGNLYALDAATGTKKWAYHTGGYVSSPLAVANGVVYVGSTDGNLYALDATIGTKKWAYHTGRYITSSPVVAGGMVYVGSWDYNLYALDAATGTKKWAYQTGRYIASTPSVMGDVVYVSSADGNLYALDAATGTKKWAYPVLFWLVVGGVVYISSRDGNLYAFHLPGT